MNRTTYSTRKIGQLGEALAAAHLQQLGYRTLARNWRHGRGEIDLVLEHENTIVFAEVKTRRSEVESAAEAVTATKLAHLQKTALAWIAADGWKRPFRFDIVVVHLPDVGQPVFEHLKDVAP